MHVRGHVPLLLSRNSCHDQKLRRRQARVGAHLGTEHAGLELIDLRPMLGFPAGPLFRMTGRSGAGSRIELRTAPSRSACLPTHRFGQAPHALSVPRAPRLCPPPLLPYLKGQCFSGRDSSVLHAAQVETASTSESGRGPPSDGGSAYGGSGGGGNEGSSEGRQGDPGALPQQHLSSEVADEIVILDVGREWDQAGWLAMTTLCLLRQGCNHQLHDDVQECTAEAVSDASSACSKHTPLLFRCVAAFAQPPAELLDSTTTASSQARVALQASVLINLTTEVALAEVRLRGAHQHAESSQLQAIADELAQVSCLSPAAHL